MFVRNSRLIKICTAVRFGRCVNYKLGEMVWFYSGRMQKSGVTQSTTDSATCHPPFFQHFLPYIVEICNTPWHPPAVAVNMYWRWRRVVGVPHGIPQLLWRARKTVLNSAMTNLCVTYLNMVVNQSWAKPLLECKPWLTSFINYSTEQHLFVRHTG